MLFSPLLALVLLLAVREGSSASASKPLQWRRHQLEPESGQEMSLLDLKQMGTVGQSASDESNKVKAKDVECVIKLYEQASCSGGYKKLKNRKSSHTWDLSADITGEAGVGVYLSANIRATCISVNVSVLGAKFQDVKCEGVICAKQCNNQNYFGDCKGMRSYAVKGKMKDCSCALCNGCLAMFDETAFDPNSKLFDVRRYDMQGVIKSKCVELPNANSGVIALEASSQIRCSEKKGNIECESSQFVDDQKSCKAPCDAAQCCSRKEKCKQFRCEEDSEVPSKKLNMTCKGRCTAEDCCTTIPMCQDFCEERGSLAKDNSARCSSSEDCSEADCCASAHPAVWTYCSLFTALLALFVTNFLIDDW